VKLDKLAQKSGIGELWVKDESKRFGLNAFKALGATYAIGKVLARKLSADIEDLSFELLKSKEVKARLGDITFTTTTDGNHGRGVAWAARELGQKAVIYMPKGSSKRRLDAILETGAKAYITDLNYDDAVRMTWSKARENNWELIQDTAWEGYEEAPYTIIMEPENAACIFKSARINDGKPHSVEGDLSTIMAGLSCGEPNPIGWEIMRDYAGVFFSCSDYIAERGIRVLANPLPGDERIISGESGSVGIGLLSLLAGEEKYRPLLRDMGIGKDSRILVISTEGDTDPEKYQEILWG
jgi:diaminopropionate ammonia-lyase